MCEGETLTRSNFDSQNPYSSPQALTDDTEQATGAIRPLAVFVGWILDVGCTMVVSLVLGVVAGSMLVAQRVPPEEFVERLMEMHWLNGLGVLGGLCGTMLGGYIAAWLGRGRPTAHGVAVGIASLITGIVPMLFFSDMQPMWVSVVCAVFTLPAGMLGGYLRGQRQRPREAKTSV